MMRSEPCKTASALRRSVHGRMNLRTATLLLASLLVVPAVGQSSDAPVKRVIPPSDAKADGPAPLLREGGLFLEVSGRITRDTRLGVHVFNPSPSQGGGVQRELILLPSRGLEDLARIEEVRHRLDEDPMSGTFEVTGRVLVYQGRNFLLPEAIVPVAAPPSSAPTGAPDPGSGPPDEDDIAARLEDRLESRLGAVPRSIDLEEAGPVSTAPIRSGIRFVDRRGHVSRDPESGVWRFVPAGADSSVGVVVLLPCLELQRLERAARQRDVSAAMLVSGQVTVYRGRNYLLPTSVRAAREGRGIGP